MNSPTETSWPMGVGEMTRSRGTRRRPAGDRTSLAASDRRSVGIPMNWPRGIARIRPRLNTEAWKTAGVTRSLSSPTSRASRSASGLLATNDSAPSSTAIPATSLTESLPPTWGAASRRVTSISEWVRTRYQAAASPEMPPPTTTTCLRGAGSGDGVGELADAPVLRVVLFAVTGPLCHPRSSGGRPDPLIRGPPRAPAHWRGRARRSGSGPRDRCPGAPRGRG